MVGKRIRDDGRRCGRGRRDLRYRNRAWPTGQLSRVDATGVASLMRVRSCNALMFVFAYSVFINQFVVFFFFFEVARSWLPGCVW